MSVFTFLGSSPSTTYVSNLSSVNVSMASCNGTASAASGCLYLNSDIAFARPARAILSALALLSQASRTLFWTCFRYPNRQFRSLATLAARAASTAANEASQIPRFVPVVFGRPVRWSVSGQTTPTTGRGGGGLIAAARFLDARFPIRPMFFMTNGEKGR